MPYDLFLFDLDDTLLDFQASERLAFYSSLQDLGVTKKLDDLYLRYQVENQALWQLFERAQTTKEHLKVERFRKLFAAHGIEIDPVFASDRYLEALAQKVVLIDHAPEICEWLSERGEIGIITNGIQQVATRRIQNSAIAPYISFVSVSESLGYAKPDVRFFSYSVKMAKKFTHATSLVVGDRMETDIQGAHHFGVDACWFNPQGKTHSLSISAKHEVRHLSELRKIIDGSILSKH